MLASLRPQRRRRHPSAFRRLGLAPLTAQEGSGDLDGELTWARNGDNSAPGALASTAAVQRRHVLNQGARSARDLRCVTGMQGCGVSTPRAAVVAAATCGLLRVVHMPKGRIFFIGTESWMLAAGKFDPLTIFSGVTISVDGATPNVQAHIAPLTTSGGILVPAKSSSRSIPRGASWRTPAPGRPGRHAQHFLQDELVAPWPSRRRPLCHRRAHQLCDYVGLALLLAHVMHGNNVGDGPWSGPRAGCAGGRRAS